LRVRRHAKPPPLFGPRPFWQPSRSSADDENSAIP
jgi:hypothetical protein